MRSTAAFLVGLTLIYPVQRVLHMKAKFFQKMESVDSYMHWGLRCSLEM